MTSKNLELTYRDVRMILALIDNWNEGRIHFVHGELSVDACVGTQLPRTERAPGGVPRVTVKAPAIGVFHRHHEGAPDVEDLLVKDSVIGTIIAPGRATPVLAGIEGRLIEFVVNDGQFVEYGQPVAIVDSTI